MLTPAKRSTDLRRDREGAVDELSKTLPQTVPAPPGADASPGGTLALPGHQRDRRQLLGRVFALLLAVFAALSTQAARADGEVGVVIQEGEVVTTYCVAFTGDSISGDEALRRAGRTFGQGGGGSGRTVCSIDGVGCFNVNPSDFNSCFCQCTTSDCTYWAFFTRAYGRPWAYSGLAFNLIEAKDGDVHGWKWGKGSPSSAPVPRDVTFDQICGGPPRGGASAPAPPATPTVAVTLTNTPAPPAAGATITTAPTATTEPGETAPANSPAALTPLPATASPGFSATVPITPAPRTPQPTALAPAAGGDEPDGGDSAQLLAFGAIAGLLVAAIAGGLVWRRTHGG